jgi:hypothetical protein
MEPIHWTLLAEVDRLNVASGSQLRRLYFQPSPTGQRMARLQLKRLVDSRILSRLGRTVGGVRAGSEGWTYSVDVAGKRLLHPGRSRQWSPWTPGSHHLRHAVAVSELYVELRGLESEGCTELLRFDAEPISWRFFSGAGGERQALKPDAFVVVASEMFEDSWFVEIDRGTESTTVIEQKAKAYLRYWQSGREQANHGVFPTVLFVVPNDSRKQQIVDVLARTPPSGWHLFQVVTSDHAARAMSTGELINNNSNKEVNP